jgi:hypothetical protein
MKLIRKPKNGEFKSISLSFMSQSDIRECICESVRVARAFSNKLTGCRVEFELDGISLEVTEFSNPDDLTHYYFMRRRLRRAQSTFDSLA